jgi:hypothetical protein
VGDRTLCSVSVTCGMQHVWAEGQRRLIDLFAATRLSALAAHAPAGDQGVMAPQRMRRDDSSHPGDSVE